ncbi:hypothetical protein L9F63_022325, partial [Diploptera punctata]
EEIGEVFDQWQNNRKPTPSIPIPRPKKTAPLPPPRNRNSNKERPKREDFTTWSDGLLAEFNNIIEQELSQLENNHDVTPDNCNNNKNMRLRITRSRSWENGAEVSTSPSLHHRALGLTRVLRRQRHVVEQSPGDAVLVSVGSLPDSELVQLTASDTDLASRNKNDVNLGARSDSTSALSRLMRKHVIKHRNNKVEDRKTIQHDGAPTYIVETVLPDAHVDTGTQTSPPLSRSSSFTWVSTSSLLLQPTMKKKKKMTMKTDPQLRHPLERDEPESGIGTASPPRSKQHTPVSSSNKVRRKETWERLRRRGSSGRPVYRVNEDVWVRRENVETQTRDDCCSLPRAVRPRCLPIKPQQPSPSEDRQSPSSASLKLSTTPITADLGNKSSSAPLLVKQVASPGAGGGKPEDNAKKRVSGLSLHFKGNFFSRG